MRFRTTRSLPAPPFAGLPCSPAVSTSQRRVQLIPADSSWRTPGRFKSFVIVNNVTGSSTASCHSSLLSRCHWALSWRWGCWGKAQRLYSFASSPHKNCAVVCAWSMYKNACSLQPCQEDFVRLPRGFCLVFTNRSVRSGLSSMVLSHIKLECSWPSFFLFLFKHFKYHLHFLSELVLFRDTSSFSIWQYLFSGWSFNYLLIFL